jgi:hypothetical protein
VIFCDDRLFFKEISHELDFETQQAGQMLPLRAKIVYQTPRARHRKGKGFSRGCKFKHWEKVLR